MQMYPHCYACRKHHQKCRFNQQDKTCDYCIKQGYECHPAPRSTITGHKPERSTERPSLARIRRAERFARSMLPPMPSAPKSEDASVSPAANPAVPAGPATFAVTRKEASEEKDSRILVKELRETVRSMEDEFQDILEAEHEKHAKELRSMQARHEEELQRQRERYERRIDNLIEIVRESRRVS
ncbi:hypothetical protein F4779DRAFT_168497 [Xylariaceae sp. FL0662B]|nr:hypothetical protein F4779DRAFT_168497 [Xylariaceae sp. FL0662B]